MLLAQLTDIILRSFLRCLVEVGLEPLLYFHIGLEGLGVALILGVQGFGVLPRLRFDRFRVGVAQSLGGGLVLL